MQVDVLPPTVPYKITLEEVPLSGTSPLAWKLGWLITNFIYKMQQKAPNVKTIGAQRLQHAAFVKRWNSRGPQLGA